MNSKLAVSRVLNITELLCLIFTFCLPDEPRKLEHDPEDWSLVVNSHLQFPSISEEGAPLSLAHVSRLWRSVALATPELWACVHFHMDRPYWLKEVYPKRMLQALLFWLKQSRSLPLSVRISRSDSKCDDAESIYLTAMVDALLKYTKRWEDISIELPETAISPFYHPSNYEFPCLKTFELKHALSGHPLRQRDIFHRSAPNLRSLAISGAQPTELPINLRSLSYANMTICINRRPRGTSIKELVLSNVKISDKAVIRFSAVFPLLERLVVSFVLPTTRFRGDPPQEDDREEDEPQQCFLDNLISLSIQNKGSYFPLNLVTAPVLEELKIATRKMNPGSSRSDDHGITIIEFLQRSHMRLQKFSYSTGGDEATNTDLESILRAMPDLQELSVEHPKLCRSDLRMLHDPSIGPRLSVIHSFGEIVVRDEWHRTWDRKDEPGFWDIVDLIRARCRKRGPADCGFGESKEGGSEIWDRVWVKRLEMPLHDVHEEKLRENEVFRMADIEFINTHRCIGSYWCGRPVPGADARNVRFFEGKRDY